jgi:hypothetical protein
LGNDVKTPGSSEPVPLSEYACDVLRAWNKEQASKSPFVFPSPHLPDQPISTVKTAWKATLKRAGVPHFPLYNLRHVFCTRLSGVAPDAVVQRAMRHTSPENQAALPVGNGGSGTASNGEIQQEGVRARPITTFLRQWPEREEGKRESRL